MHDGDSSGDLALDRLVFFSDAVFAIAITLLVLELEVPSLAARATAAQSWHALRELIPSLFAFVLSFFVIGRSWMGHHAQFRGLRRFDDRLMWPNLFYLLTIAFMPFATAFMGRNLGHFVPALVYNMTMVALALTALWLGRVIDRVAERSPTFAALDLLAASLVCVGLTFFVPLLSQWGMITMPLWDRLEKRFVASRLAAARA